MNTELLDRIDAALARMRERGHDGTIHYENLQRKREAVAQGHGRFVDMNEQIQRIVADLLHKFAMGHDVAWRAHLKQRAQARKAKGAVIQQNEVGR